MRKTDRIVDTSENSSQVNNIISISVNKKVCWQKQGQSSSSKTSSTKKATSMMNTTATSSSKDRLMKRLLREINVKARQKVAKDKGSCHKYFNNYYLSSLRLFFSSLDFNLPSATRFFPLLIFKGIPLDVANTASTRDLMPKFLHKSTLHCCCLVPGERTNCGW